MTPRKRVNAVGTEPAGRSMWRKAVAGLFVVAILGSTIPASAQTLVNRPFEDETWTEGLVDVRSLDISRTNLIDNGFAGSGLQVGIPEGGFRGLGPLDRLGPQDRADQAPDEAYFRYHIRLLSWNAAFTGKLPGLAGLYSSSGRGCIPPTEQDPGWSARGLFGPPGTQGAAPGEVPIGTYLYHADQAGTCGDTLWWDTDLEQGRWYCVEGHVRMNTPGANNGVLRAWVDGEQVLRKTNIQFRRAGEGHIGVRHMWHNVYFGGSWSTPNPLSLVYDQVVVSDSHRVGCMTPFTDIANTVHANALTELHALGHLLGCEYRKACPARELTRGEAAAFFSRIFRLPAPNRDFFDDDKGNIFEGAINRMAAAGITEGCASRAFCPDVKITRAQFAAMVVRAMSLWGDAANAFGDDDGHWAENAIDKLAEAGLTNGCADDRFCPNDPLTRDETTTFFLRMLKQVEPLGLQGIEPPPDYPPPGEPPPIPPEERD